MDQIWAKLDVDGNGKLSFEEFTQFMINKNKDNDNKHEIIDSFRSLANDKVNTSSFHQQNYHCSFIHE